MKIIQQNINKDNKKINELMEEILKKNPDVIFFSEFCFHAHNGSIVDKLKGFNFYLPMDFEERDKSNPQMWASCGLAVKERLRFEQRRRENVLQAYRYIEGKLIDLNNSLELECFFAYVQQLYIPPRPNYTKDTVDTCIYNANRKANMLFEIYRFTEENKDKYFFIGGDLNTDITEDRAEMKSIFKPTHKNTIDTFRGHTWKDKQQLDYALISKKLNEDWKCKTESLKTTSDHIALCTDISKK